VVVDSLSGAAASVQGEDSLYPVEQFSAYEWRGYGGRRRARCPDVVAVGQDVVELVERYRFGCGAFVAAGGEAGGGELVEDLSGAVLAGGVQLEALLDVWSAVRVDVNRSDLRIAPGWLGLKLPCPWWQVRVAASGPSLVLGRTVYAGPHRDLISSQSGQVRSRQWG